jgi:hypothetical protein
MFEWYDYIGLAIAFLIALWLIFHHEAHTDRRKHWKDRRQKKSRRR